jgi:hypothetical protein
VHGHRERKKGIGGMKATPPLTLAEAAHIAGITGRPRNAAKKLRHMILVKERRIKKPIMLRNGGNGKGARYLVTMWSLRRYLPELFDRRDEIVERFRAEMAEVVERLAEHEALIEHLGQIVGAKIRAGELPGVTKS